MNRTDVSRCLKGLMMVSLLVSGAAGAGPAPAEPTGEVSGHEMAGGVDDSAVTAKVRAALDKAALTDGSRIRVDTQQGRVTLSGEVSSREQAEKAVEAARRAAGENEVRDRLQVTDAHRSSGGYLDDAGITARVKAGLLSDSVTPGLSIGVETIRGTVHLTGTVESQAQAEEAEKITKSIEGVKEVRNDLKVRQP